MAGASKAVGAILVAIGLSLVVAFGFYTVRDEEYPKAALLLERNPGNVLYEARYGAAFIKRMFLMIGATAGGLVALNGATFFLIGVMAKRQEIHAPEPPSG